MPIFVILQLLYAQTRRVTGQHIVNFSAITISLFFLIILTNLMRIIPYVMGPSTHIAFTLSLALPVWLRTVFSGFSFSPYL